MPEAEAGISVVIPTFQRREQVLQAIDSALAQDLPPDEVVVVDDGSTDGTAEAVTARYGDRVRLLRQHNRGPAAARNAAIDIAVGDVIAFLDSDDRWLPHHLAVVAELFARNPTAVLVGTQRDCRFGDEAASGAQLVDLAEDLLLCRLEVGMPSSVAVRRGAFEAVGGFDEQLRYAEDNQLYVLLALQGPVSLISARTIDRSKSVDSLSVEGRSTGAFAGFLERSADRALAALDRCQRPDTAALRTAARARRAIGAAATSLARGESAERVQHHLAEVRRCMPAHDAEAAVITQAEWIVPGWEHADQRHRVAMALRQAGRALNSSSNDPER